MGRRGGQRKEKQKQPEEVKCAAHGSIIYHPKVIVTSTNRRFYELRLPVTAIWQI